MSTAAQRAWANHSYWDSPPPITPEGATMNYGAELIAVERQRQLDVEGWTPEHDDDEHETGELAMAAVCYATESVQPGDGDGLWPWDPSQWKPSDDPVRNLEKAGALIAAEIDRLIRRRSKP